MGSIIVNGILNGGLQPASKQQKRERLDDQGLTRSGPRFRRICFECWNHDFVLVIAICI